MDTTITDVSPLEGDRLADAKTRLREHAAPAGGARRGLRQQPVDFSAAEHLRTLGLGSIRARDHEPIGRVSLQEPILDRLDEAQPGWCQREPTVFLESRGGGDLRPGDGDHRVECRPA